MILNCQNLSKSFGADDIFKQVSFHIDQHEKAAVAGINGAGKSTLLKIIMQELSPDEGSVVLAKNASVGYLAQYQDVSAKHSIYEEVLSSKAELIHMESRLREMEQEMHVQTGEALNHLLERYNRIHQEFDRLGGYAYRSEVTGIIRGLGFGEEDFSRPIQSLSGGQKTRVFLGKLLVSKPDLLILDEPTNHLDMSSIAWLENFLSNYKGAVLIVSHDRYFLDQIVTKVIELSLQKAIVFPGNYSDFAVKKAALLEAQLKAWQNQQRDIKHQEEVIAKLKSFNREKSIRRAESREKMLNKMDRLEKPMEEHTDMRIRFEPGITSGNDVLRAEGLAKSFGSNHLFSDLSFEIKRGERVALIGNNGTGKTTILKIINELLPMDAGRITLGTNVKIGYYDQEHHLLHDNNTLFEEISNASPSLTNTQVRNILALFLFTDDDVFKHVGELSGGEKGRLSLAKLMLSEANFLILDEPTNHLDIISREILESALKKYAGTVFFVSHDRYFINKTATRILDLTHHTLVNYIGNYDYYLEKRNVQLQNAAAANLPEKPMQKNKTGKEDWKLKKEEQAKIKKREAALKRTEDAIADAEARIQDLYAEMNLPDVACDAKRLTEIDCQLTEWKGQLDDLYADWEELAE